MNSNIDYEMIDLRINEAEILAKINNNKVDFKTAENNIIDLYEARIKLLARMFSKLPKVPIPGSLSPENEFLILAEYYEYNKRYLEMISKHPCFYTYKNPEQKLNIEKEIVKCKDSTTQLFAYLTMLKNLKN
jgi:hypothetical protein